MADEELERLPSTLFEHYCEEPGCKVWGMVDYEPVKGQGQPWCCEHFQDREWFAARRRLQKN